MNKKDAKTVEKPEKKPEKNIDKKQNQEIEKLKKENKEQNEKILRIMAEIQNIRRRNEEERTKLLKYEGEELIKDLLPIIDNFERAILIDESKLSDDVKNFLEGFKMIYANIISILKEKEVVEIDCIGKEFDPNCMEAVLTEQKKDTLPGTVIDCLQKGYTYNGKVLRVAMVKVSE